MYREFFGLQLLPFNNTPDPRFFFNTPDHEEALAALLYATQERKGFVLVTGEVGAGKTLLTRVALERFESGIVTATLHNTRLGGRDLLVSICREFEVPISADLAPSEISAKLETFLLEQYRRDRIVAIIIDEAQNLTPEAFEELRLLGNLEADDAKLVQVLILGQPELQATFRLPHMHQIQQRLFRSLHLEALTGKLTGEYIAHRLRVAGWPEDRPSFDVAALEIIFGYSKGIPRLVNQLCDNVLLAAYADSTPRISAKLVRDVVEQMSGAAETSTRQKIEKSKLPGASTDVSIADYGDSHKLDESKLRPPAKSANASAQSKIPNSKSKTDPVPAEASQYVHQSVDRFLATIKAGYAQIEAKKQELTEFSREARRAMNNARVEALARANSIGAEPADLLSETRQLLNDTRQQADMLMDHLRAQIGRQTQTADETWQHMAVVGGKTLVEMIGRLNEARTAAEQAGEESRQTLGELTRKLLETKTAVERLFERRQCETTLISAETNTAKKDLEAFYESVRDHLEKDLSDRQERLARHAAALTEKARENLDEVGKQSSQQAQQLKESLQTAAIEFERTTAAMRDTVNGLQKDAAAAREEYGHSAAAMRRERAEIMQDLQGGIRKYSTQADALEEGLGSAIEKNAAQLDLNRSAAQDAIAQVEHVSQAIREQGKRSVQEVRACLLQMHESADLIKADLRTIGEDLRRGATSATSRIEAVAERVETQAATAVQSAREMVNEVQQGATALLANANQVFEQAYKEAEDTEHRLVTESAERLAELKGEGQRLLSEMGELHSVSVHDMEEIRSFLAEARQDVVALSASAQQYQEQVLTAHADVKNQSDQILREARDVQRQAAELLSHHQQLTSEAQERAAAISQMSKTLTGVLKQLQTAGRAAQENHDRLSVENQGAEQKLAQMRQHSQRLGQLVGIIRQVYGTIDARVEGLRYGLAAAEQFVNNEGPKNLPATTPGIRHASAPRKDQTAAQQPSRGSLGDVVSRNQKLNTWLKEVLDQAESVPATNQPVRREEDAVLSKAS